MAEGECFLELDDSESDEDDSKWVEEDEDGQTPAKCLFCIDMFPTLEELFSHCSKKHKFIISEAQRTFSLDCIKYIKMINYIRRCKPEPEEVLKADSTSVPWSGDEFMQPVDPEDPLLQFDIESMELDDSPIEKIVEPNDDDQMFTLPFSKYKRLLHRLEQSERKVSQLELSLKQSLDDLTKMREVAKHFMLNSPDPSPAVPSQSALQNMTADEDDAYFSSYGHFSIHEEMLKDKVRTESYRDFMYKNPDLFKDKIVLDVGCGTGILSMFAAKAGAKQVIGVDQSDIIYQAIDIVRENGLEDVITLVKGRLEDVVLPVKKVDIIISEWMGYFLLFESMLDTVIYARNKWLSPGGLVFPDRCNIVLCASSDPDLHTSHVTYWQDVYGFKMRCMKSSVIKEALVTVVNKEYICTDPCTLQEIDCLNCCVKDLRFASPFKLICKSNCSITAIIGYFDIFFYERCTNKTMFSTSPHSIPTHWKQTVFLLENPITASDGDILEGVLTCKKNRKDPRTLVVSINLQGKIFKYLME